MYIADLVRNPDRLEKWSQGWVESCKEGSHTGVKMIHDLAKKIKDKYYTNGVWNPDALAAYNSLREYAGLAQDEYEKAMPGIED